MDSEFEPKNHPSYGTVMFTRTHCGGGREKLFGSAITNHFTTVKLTIREAELRHKYHEDRIWGDRKIIEVELSAAQFVELLTTMNVGTGTPCTIRFRQDVGKIEIPSPPARGRGLKPSLPLSPVGGPRSPPARGRGLKR